MPKVTTPKDETSIVLTLGEYERLGADIADATRIKADIKSGRAELVPSEVVDRLLEGENPVRVWRKHRGLTAKDLAVQTSVSPAYLSEIEAGKKEGSVSVMKRIAVALNVDLGDLV